MLLLPPSFLPSLTHSLPSLPLFPPSLPPSLTPSLPPSLTPSLPPSLSYLPSSLPPSLTHSLPPSLPYSLSLPFSLPPSLPPSLQSSPLPPLLSLLRLSSCLLPSLGQGSTSQRCFCYHGNSVGAVWLQVSWLIG